MRHDDDVIGALLDPLRSCRLQYQFWFLLRTSTSIPPESLTCKYDRAAPGFSFLRLRRPPLGLPDQLPLCLTDQKQGSEMKTPNLCPLCRHWRKQAAVMWTVNSINSSCSQKHFLCSAKRHFNSRSIPTFWEIISSLLPRVRWEDGFPFDVSDSGYDSNVISQNVRLLLYSVFKQLMKYPQRILIRPPVKGLQYIQHYTIYIHDRYSSEVAYWSTVSVFVSQPGGEVCASVLVPLCSCLCIWCIMMMTATTTMMKMWQEEDVCQAFGSLCLLQYCLSIKVSLLPLCSSVTDWVTSINILWLDESYQIERVNLLLFNSTFTYVGERGCWQIRL